jgi:hypothetical protein
MEIGCWLPAHCLFSSTGRRMHWESTTNQNRNRRTSQAIRIGQSGKDTNLVGVFKGNAGRHDAASDGFCFVVCVQGGGQKHRPTTTINRIDANGAFRFLILLIGFGRAPRLIVLIS